MYLKGLNEVVIAMPKNIMCLDLMQVVIWHTVCVLFVHGLFSAQVDGVFAPHEKQWACAFWEIICWLFFPTVL